MGTLRKALLVVLLLGILLVILLTWGSIGSGVLTLSLILSGSYLLLSRFQDTHDPQDYRME